MAEPEIQETELVSVATETVSYKRKDGTDGTIYKIGGEDQKVYSTFSDTIAKIFEAAGTKRKIKYKVVIQGNYTNLNIVDVADEKGEFGAYTSKGGGRGFKADPAKTESIERQVAVIQTVLLINAKSVKLEEFETWAERIHNWIKGNGDGSKS